MKFNPGTVIPAGYIVKITTWENDGDYYKDKYHFGLTQSDVQFFELVKPYFDSRHNGGKHRSYGNGEYSPYMAETFFELMGENLEFSEQFKKFMGLDSTMYDPEDGDYTNSFSHDKFCEHIQENFTNYSTDSYDADFIRVIETVEVYHSENEYVVPELPLTKIKEF